MPAIRVGQKGRLCDFGGEQVHVRDVQAAVAVRERAYMQEQVRCDVAIPAGHV